MQIGYCHIPCSIESIKIQLEPKNLKRVFFLPTFLFIIARQKLCLKFITKCISNFSSLPLFPYGISKRKTRPTYHLSPSSLYFYTIVSISSVVTFTVCQQIASYAAK